MIANERHLREFRDSQGKRVSMQDVLVGTSGYRGNQCFFRVVQMYASQAVLRWFNNYEDALKHVTISGKTWGDKVGTEQMKNYTIINENNLWRYKK
jgi:hypothetical protein